MDGGGVAVATEVHFMKRPAVFFDRDNTLIVSDGYLGDPDRVVLVDGASEAVARVREMGFAAVVFSNQSGVARGMFGEDAVYAVNHRLDELLHEDNPAATIDRHEFCPFHPQAPVEKYRQESELRKPKPGMIHQAARTLDLDLSRSWVVGDAPRDIEAGHVAGVRTILLKIPGLPPSVALSERLTVQPDYTAWSLKEAIDFIQRNRNKPSGRAAEVEQSAEVETAEAESEAESDGETEEPVAVGAVAESAAVEEEHGSEHSASRARRGDHDGTSDTDADGERMAEVAAEAARDAASEDSARRDEDAAVEAAAETAAAMVAVAEAEAELGAGRESDGAATAASAEQGGASEAAAEDDDGESGPRSSAPQAESPPRGRLTLTWGERMRVAKAQGLLPTRAEEELPTPRPTAMAVAAAAEAAQQAQAPATRETTGSSTASEPNRPTAPVSALAAIPAEPETAAASAAHPDPTATTTRSAAEIAESQLPVKYVATDRTSSAPQQSREERSASGAGAAEPQAAPRDIARLTDVAEQILQELKRANEHVGDFSVGKVLAGVLQILVLAGFVLAYMRWDVPNNEAVKILLVTVALQAFTISLTIMGKQR
jgi:D-glycero-D-manno-heptose 1,7-bisphosphate phosphatase